MWNAPQRRCSKVFGKERRAFSLTLCARVDRHGKKLEILKNIRMKNEQANYDANGEMVGKRPKQSRSFIGEGHRQHHCHRESAEHNAGDDSPDRLGHLGSNHQRAEAVTHLCRA